MDTQKVNSIYFVLVAIVAFFVFFFVVLRAVSFQMQKPLPTRPVFVKITIPEGYTVKDISEKFDSFENFDKENFLEIAGAKEGYLFPDTYFFTGSENETQVVVRLENNFRKKVFPIFTQSDKNRESPISQSEIGTTSTIIMASILEREARTTQDWKIISGILWKRVGIGMPLQVDATLNYLNGKTSSELTLDDLQTDSLYNTYTRRGLPPTPICNPGLGAIEAAGNPVESPYFYYLSDKEGTTHFAKTFDEHKLNKARYLR